mmetsp:Transcript_34695/g.109563  ORF Transcript_34695/g.109563 Transcript_34695/m.109563 type:complete len:431 (-) Transcript_34695:71-1363(-)
MSLEEAKAAAVAAVKHHSRLPVVRKLSGDERPDSPAGSIVDGVVRGRRVRLLLHRLHELGCVPGGPHLVGDDVACEAIEREVHPGVGEDRVDVHFALREVVGAGLAVVGVDSRGDGQVQGERRVHLEGDAAELEGVARSAELVLHKSTVIAGPLRDHHLRHEDGLGRGGGRAVADGYVDGGGRCTLRGGPKVVNCPRDGGETPHGVDGGVPDDERAEPLLVLREEVAAHHPQHLRRRRDGVHVDAHVNEASAVAVAPRDGDVCRHLRCRRGNGRGDGGRRHRGGGGGGRDYGGHLLSGNSLLRCDFFGVGGRVCLRLGLGLQKALDCDKGVVGLLLEAVRHGLLEGLPDAVVVEVRVLGHALEDDLRGAHPALELGQELIKRPLQEVPWLFRPVADEGRGEELEEGLQAMMRQVILRRGHLEALRPDIHG